MEFKQLDIEPEGSWIKRKFWSQHVKKTLVYIALGSVAGVLFFYFTEGKELAEITSGEIIKGMLFGGFLGFFITNSPCARNKC